jgi:hypothetical protein
MSAKAWLLDWATYLFSGLRFAVALILIGLFVCPFYMLISLLLLVASFVAGETFECELGIGDKDDRV